MAHTSAFDYHSGTVTCDWRLISLGCPCGAVTHEHGLAFSEVWLLLPDL
ncbi:hypothetical protein ACFUJR_32990 [Streptomyces sp. NPDC057271]